MSHKAIVTGKADKAVVAGKTFNADRIDAAGKAVMAVKAV